MNDQEWKDAQRADWKQKQQYLEDLLANRVPSGGLPDGVDLIDAEDSSHQRWTAEDVARFTTSIYGIPDGALDEGLYWDSAMQATAMLMAALHVLARELHDNHRRCGHGMPALVDHVVRQVISKAPLLRAKVVEALL